MSGPVETWSVTDVENMLASLNLNHLAPVFKENGVSGKDLLTFGNTEYLDDLGCTKMQMHKIRRQLISAGARIKEDDNEASAPAAAPASAPAYNPQATGSYAPPAQDPFAPQVPPRPTYPPAQDPFAPQPAYPAYSAAPSYGAPQAAPSSAYGGAAYGQPAASGYGAPAPGYGVPAVAAVAVGVAVVDHAAERDRYARAHGLLERALGEMQQAHQIMARASMTATMGIVGDLRHHDRFEGPRHHRNEQIGNFMEHREMDQASQLISVSANKIQEAKMMCPDLPEIDMAKVNKLRPGIVFEGGAMMEMMRKRKIEESKREVEEMMRCVDRAKNYCIQRMR